MKDWLGKTAIILGTGPSLTTEVIAQVLHFRINWPGAFRVFVVNNVYTQNLIIDVLYANNREWWDYYGDDAQAVCSNDTDMWTFHEDIAKKRGINYVEGRWSGDERQVNSLSRDPAYIHWGHGSGYEVLGLAYLHGCRDFVLAGYDLRFPGGYNARKRNPGTGRHFFGEYPEGKGLTHWPGRTGKNIDAEGNIVGLLDCYRTIDCDKLDLTITNCSPDTALDFFGVGDLEKELEVRATRFRLFGKV